MMAQPRQTTAVVGLGLSGMSVLKHLSATDALVVIDDRPAPANLPYARQAYPDAQFFIGPESSRPERWANVERVLVSPGVAANDPLLAGSERLPRLSDIDLFMESAGVPVVGITGTNGKSTVTALLGHILARLGVAVRVGGNLGEPALDLLADADGIQVYVLELSSFQIEHSGELPLAAAAVLNVTPDHLDRHGDMAAYAAIKRDIYAHARISLGNVDDAATLEGANLTFGGAAAADWQLVEAAGCAPALHYRGHRFAGAGDFALTGRHNLLNLLAAFALAASLDLPGLPAFAGNEARYVAAASDFSGLAHRSELVRELRGVRYVNDSKATNVGACIAALDGYSERASVILIAGGQGKDADFSPLAEAASRCVRHALLIGEDAGLLERALAGAVDTQRCNDLAQAVQSASELGRAGDTVLLAPACASFDMFASFADRGDAYTELVGALA